MSLLTLFSRVGLLTTALTPALTTALTIALTTYSILGSDTLNKKVTVSLRRKILGPKVWGTATWAKEATHVLH